MSGYTELDLWLHEYELAALEEAVQEGMTAQAYLQAQVIKAYEELVPPEIRRPIQERIEQERAEAQAQAEANRCFAAFRITEHGREEYYQSDRRLEFLGAARLLRAYLRKDRKASAFVQMIACAEPITQERYDELIQLRMDNTGRVSGAFELDFDSQQMSALNIMDGWFTFRMADVSSAIYYADLKQGVSEDRRLSKFLEKLDGKELTYEPPELQISLLHGCRHLRPEDITFVDEVEQENDLLKFSVIVEDPEDVFGLFIDYDSTDDFLLTYAHYNLERNCICNTLDVFVDRGTSEESYQYQLSMEEQALLLPKMDAFCRKQLGQNLAERCQKYREEQTSGSAPEQPDGPETGMRMKGV